MLCYEQNNFLGEHLHTHVRECIMHKDYPWFFLPDITRELHLDDDDYAQPGFQHTPFKGYHPTSTFYDSISFLPGLIGRKIEELTDYKFERLLLDRLRVGLNIPLTNESRKFNLPYNYPHLDCDAKRQGVRKHWTALYYVNNCDGNTFIFEETEKQDKCEDYTIAHSIEPKPDKLLIFDGEQYHASSSPIKASSRIVITVNFHVR